MVFGYLLRVGLALILFWVIVIWGLIDGEIYAKEGAIYIAIWLALVAGVVLYKSADIGCIVGMFALDIYLLFRVFWREYGDVPLTKGSGA